MRADIPQPPPGTPRFNWAAFFFPPVWGLANGQWAGVFFLPLWVFVGNVFEGPSSLGMLSPVLGWSMVFVTVGAQAAFAWNANRVSWLRVEGRVDPEVFVRHQRIWGAVGLAAAFIAGALIITERWIP